jgi:hypothetical protein
VFKVLWASRFSLSSNLSSYRETWFDIFSIFSFFLRFFFLSLSPSGDGRLEKNTELWL